MSQFPQSFGPDGRYQLLHLLGEGEGGRVFAARDTQQDKQLALKQLTRRRTPQELERRFAALSQLKHPNLVELFSMYSTWEPPFYTMQLVPGVDVVRYIRQPSEALFQADNDDELDGNLLLGERSRASSRSVFSAPASGGFERAREVARQLCAGLDYTHAHGFIHRDLTRGNIRVTEQHQVVVMDYGLAAEHAPGSPGGPSPVTPGPTPNEMIGTAAYMAPEQWDTKELSPAVDWYSLGVILFEGLCGALPFVGSAHEVLLRKRTVSAPGPSLLLPEIPDDLDAICHGLMISDPKRRWSGARVLARLAG